MYVMPDMFLVNLTTQLRNNHYWGCLYFLGLLHFWDCLHFWGRPHFWGCLHFWGHLHHWGILHFWGCHHFLSHLHYWAGLHFKVRLHFWVVFMFEAVFIFEVVIFGYAWSMMHFCMMHAWFLKFHRNNVLLHRYKVSNIGPVQLVSRCMLSAFHKYVSHVSPCHAC